LAVHLLITCHLQPKLPFILFQLPSQKIHSILLLLNSLVIYQFEVGLFKLYKFNLDI
jgi:hypothetical protein